MPVTIREITSEVVVSGDAAPGGRAGEAAAPGEQELIERVVRHALERVLERLRMEWER